MNGYIIAAYAVTFGGLGLYSARVLVRGRTLATRIKRQEELEQDQ